MNARGIVMALSTARISTSLGRTDIKVPRVRLFGPAGETIEWQSHILPRYQRRAKALDDAILGIYLCGANTRRIKQALRPLLKGTPLSKSSISRLVLRLKEYFESWRNRALHNEFVAYLYLDGFGVTIRSCGRVCRVLVLAAVGVNEKGEKILLGLRGSESAQTWRALVEDLVSRGLPSS